MQSRVAFVCCRILGRNQLSQAFSHNGLALTGAIVAGYSPLDFAPDAVALTSVYSIEESLIPTTLKATTFAVVAHGSRFVTLLVVLASNVRQFNRSAAHTFTRRRRHVPHLQGVQLGSVYMLLTP